MSETTNPATEANPAALPKTQRDRILAEERYRQAVRSELETSRPKSFSGTLWAFLNSTFGVFFCGTVVLGLVTWGSGLYEKTSSLTTEQSRTIANLDSELSYRLVPLFELFGQDGQLNKINEAELADVVFSSKAPSAQQEYMGVESRNLLSDFKDQNIFSLLLQLKALAPHDRKDILNDAFRQAKRTQTLLNSGPKESINLASDVTDEVAILSPPQIEELQKKITPAFKGWSDQPWRN